MEASEEVVVGELRDLSHQIVKGKRTKRLRICSPIPFVIISDHLPSGEGGGYSTNEDNNISNINDDNKNGSTNNLMLSLGGSSDDENSTITTEDEDAARLLIMLSQGNSRESSTKNDSLDHKYSPPTTKFTSKKYIETSSNGKSGMFVYECKTCNRTFPSFQALGGHRASHGKPKNLVIEEIKKRPVSSVFRDDYDYDFDFHPSQLSFARNNKHNNLKSPVSQHSTVNKSNASGKMHECSYCGAEFTSGQALGGHMRRHRGSHGNNNNNVNNIQPLLSLSPSLTSSFSGNQDSVGVKKQKINKDNKDSLSLSLSMSLDLNLPASPPAENDQKIQESNEFEFVNAKRSSTPPHKRNEQQ